ncbi:MAG: hypothetical protein KJ902_04160 [Candidatus Omnitrophica bacterium]|nr:hypothetical protein [Candidatus Omnitrophota bacterium]MBU4457919.1 hypothetical protein [Candidatus Omnitrophota bacterium]
MRIAIIFILCVLLFNPAAYALRFSDTGDEDIESGEVNEEIENIKKEKQRLIEEAIPLREERAQNLRPFVYPGAPSSDIETASDAEFPPRRVSGKETYAAQPAVSQKAQAEAPAVKPRLNILFLFLIIMGFLAAYHFIKPNSK